MKKLLLPFLIISLFSSCDCYQSVSGTIIDANSGHPISRVLVYNKDKIWDSTNTDESGNFELSSISGGIGCPPMKVIAVRNNYESEETNINAGEKKEIRLKSTSKAQDDSLGQTNISKEIH